MLTDMITYQRSKYNDPNFMELVRQLDEDLKNRYKSYQEKFTALNKLDAAVKVILAYDGSDAIACGAIRPMKEAHTIELKRMFVQAAYRGRGIGKQVLQMLEEWAAEESYTIIRLETGKNQPEAIALYQKYGYRDTEPYGEYKNIEEAICMEKTVATT